MKSLSLLLALLVGSSCMGTIGEPERTAASPDDAGNSAPDAAAADAGAMGRDAGALSDGGASRTDAGTDAGVDAGTADGCERLGCSPLATCSPAQPACRCRPGFTGDGFTCTPQPAGSPGARTQTEVCDAFREGYRSRVSGADFIAGATSCDVGTLTRAALDDALARLNFHRWLVGAGPVVDSASENGFAQHCAVISAWNPAGPQAHFPPATSTCYSADGAAGAASSNIAWGSQNAADAVDQWMIDYGNDTTFGHRRWFLYPALNPVGIGFFRGGNNYGSASCATVFGASNTGPSPEWFAYPPDGFSPVSITQWTWSVHGSIPQAGATATVTRASDGAVLPVNVNVMVGSYGRLLAVTLVRQGWNPVAGEAYHVVLDGPQGPRRSWTVRPSACP
ncbi:MAG: hypothetical protein JNK82_21905 [Myxococcaceae bacterium]|nr:hypothetical protein [Myxococcaceae bacterium]